MFKWVFLATDLALFALCLSLVFYVIYLRNNAPLAAQWRRVFERPVGMVSAVILTCLLLVALMDSIHFRVALPAVSGGVPAYSPTTQSALDALLAHLKKGQEKTYSSPFASTSLVKETQQVGGVNLRDNPPLRYAGAHLRLEGQRAEITTALKLQDVGLKAVKGALFGLAVGGVLCLLWTAILLANQRLTFKQAQQMFANTALPWQAGMITVVGIAIFFSVLWHISVGWHVLGTDRAGNDVLYLTFKSIRSAVVIATLTMVVSLPFALILGIAAGTLRGWVDTSIQYVYTVMSSIPGVLLIAACVLMIQTYIDKHPGAYATALERADIKLFLLCVVLGLTSWAGLARLLRAEAMKLRELEFVQAARSFGVPSWKIMLQHIMPNTMHLLILTISMEFSALVLFEAVLSYIGIGVDPAIQSFGGMINAGRTELARNPIIWWPLTSAFIGMLVMVLSANLFADCVRDAFDPRSKILAPKRRFKLGTVMQGRT